MRSISAGPRSDAGVKMSVVKWTVVFDSLGLCHGEDVLQKGK